MNGNIPVSDGEPIHLPTLLNHLKNAFDAEIGEMDIDGGTRKLSVTHQILKGLRSIREMIQTLIVSTQEEQMSEHDIVSRIHALRVPIAVYEVLAGIGDTLGSKKLTNIASSQPHAVLQRQYGILPLAHCKMNGAAFLEHEIVNRVVQHATKPDPAPKERLVILEKKVDEAFGSEYAGLSELIYFLLDGDIRTAEEIIISQTRRKRKYPAESAQQRENFGQHFMGFLGMYGDVSEYVLKRSVHKTLTPAHIMNVLKTILQDPCLRQFTEITDNSAQNLYSVLQRSLSSADTRQNPWVHANLAHTPFAIHQLGTTMERSVPRQALGPVLVELNDHERFMHIRSAQYAIAEYDRLKNDEAAHPKIRARFIKVMRSLQLPVILDVGHTGKEDAEGKPPEEPLASMVSRLEHAIEGHENPMEETVTEEGHALPEHVMLRLIDADRIVGKQALQDEVHRLIKTIKKFSSQIRSPLLVRSLQILLHSDSPSMDIPILSTGSNRSLREELLLLAKNNYEDSVLQEGPAALLRQDVHPPAPLFRPRDAELLSCSITQLAKNFNTAAIGPERGMLIEAGKKFYEIHGYKASVRFIERAIRDYFTLGHDTKDVTSDYNVTLHPGATEAFRAFVLQCVPERRDGDYAIISNQEYGHMTDVLSPITSAERDDNSHVKIMHLNNRVTGMSRNAEELFDEFMSAYDPKHTKLVILSEVTRFGDRPCASGNPEKSQAELALYIAKVREIAPAVSIVIDGTQAIGRGQAFNLSSCAPDAYIGSGSKDLGTGTSAFMVTSRSLPIGKPFEHNPSTLPIANLVAMGIGIDRLKRTNDFMRFNGNLGASQGLQQEKRIQAHVSHLTSHAIRLTAKHAEKVIECMTVGERNSWEGINTTGKTLEECFQCRVVYPVHRNAYDTTGIMVIDFPNMKADQMASAILKADGITSLPCLENAQGLRLSFHYLHETSHIDALFEAIADAHVKKLRERSQRPQLELKAEFDMPPG